MKSRCFCNNATRPAEETYVLVSPNTLEERTTTRYVAACRWSGVRYCTSQERAPKSKQPLNFKHGGKGAPECRGREAGVRTPAGRGRSEKFKEQDE